MSNNNGHTPWGTPQEISRKEVPMSKSNGSPYEQLFIDIALRLEETNGSKALMYPFESEKSAKGAARGVAGLFARRVRKGHVTVQSGIARDGSPVLYVMRGPNYTD